MSLDDLRSIRISGIYFIARPRHFEFSIYLENQHISHDALISDMAYCHYYIYAYYVQRLVT